MFFIQIDMIFFDCSCNLMISESKIDPEFFFRNISLGQHIDNTILRHFFNRVSPSLSLVGEVRLRKTKQIVHLNPN